MSDSLLQPRAEGQKGAHSSRHRGRSQAHPGVNTRADEQRFRAWAQFVIAQGMSLNQKVSHPIPGS